MVEADIIIESEAQTCRRDRDSRRYCYLDTVEIEPGSFARQIIGYNRVFLGSGWQGSIRLGIDGTALFEFGPESSVAGGGDQVNVVILTKVIIRTGGTATEGPGARPGLSGIVRQPRFNRD